MEELLNRTGLTPSRWLVLLLFGAGALVLLGGLGNAVAYSELAVGVGIGIMVIVLGGALLSQSGRLRPSACPRHRSEAANEGRGRRP